jgi:hypothetical protein
MRMGSLAGGQPNSTVQRERDNTAICCLALLQLAVAGVYIASLHTLHQQQRSQLHDEASNTWFDSGPLVFTHLGEHERIGDAGRYAQAESRVVTREIMLEVDALEGEDEGEEEEEAAAEEEEDVADEESSDAFE